MRLNFQRLNISRNGRFDDSTNNELVQPIVSRCLVTFALFVLLLCSCERDYMFRGGTEGLRFSTDTLTFDTVFSTIGSATRNIRIYNPYDEDITIDGIELAGGDESDFRLNINGIAANDLYDVRLRSHDSLYVFIEVTVDPKGVNNPFLVMDSIMIHTLEKTQSVKLLAYGQDVIVLRKEKLTTQTLTKNKPYLIYDYVVIDSLHQVTIESGAKLHFHDKASMVVKGSLVVNGTPEEPVTFEGDRLEDDYFDIPGQWGFIHFFPGSKNNILNHAIIKNGLIGVQADSIGLGNDAPLVISNCRFEHISSVGLLAENSSIVAWNSVFADCGLHSVALTVGGNYEFYHCTIANYYPNWKTRSTAALFINNYYESGNGKVTIVPLTKANFGNCIITGRNSSELAFDLKEPDDQSDKSVANYFFDHCLIKDNSQTTVYDDKSRFSNIIINKEASFKNKDKYDYQLDTLSVAKDAGNADYTTAYPTDASGISRTEDKAPDLGAFERTETK